MAEPFANANLREGAAPAEADVPPLTHWLVVDRSHWPAVAHAVDQAPEAVPEYVLVGLPAGSRARLATHLRDGEVPHGLAVLVDVTTQRPVRVAGRPLLALAPPEVTRVLVDDNDDTWGSRVRPWMPPVVSAEED